MMVRNSATVGWRWVTCPVDVGCRASKRANYFTSTVSIIRCCLWACLACRCPSRCSSGLASIQFQNGVHSAFLRAYKRPSHICSLWPLQATGARVAQVHATPFGQGLAKRLYLVAPWLVSAVFPVGWCVGNTVSPHSVVEQRRPPLAQFGAADSPRTHQRWSATSYARGVESTYGSPGR